MNGHQDRVMRWHQRHLSSAKQRSYLVEHEPFDVACWNATADSIFRGEIERIVPASFAVSMVSTMVSALPATLPRGDVWLPLLAVKVFRFP
jgi:hypothetical protein